MQTHPLLSYPVSFHKLAALLDDASLSALGRCSADFRTAVRRLKGTDLFHIHDPTILLALHESTCIEADEAEEVFNQFCNPSGVMMESEFESMLINTLNLDKDEIDEATLRSWAPQIYRGVFGSQKTVGAAQFKNKFNSFWRSRRAIYERVRDLKLIDEKVSKSAGSSGPAILSSVLGFLDAERRGAREAHAVRTATSQKMEPVKMREMFVTYDIDRDGKLSVNEFSDAMSFMLTQLPPGRPEQPLPVGFIRFLVSNLVASVRQSECPHKWDESHVYWSEFSYLAPIILENQLFLWHEWEQGSQPAP